MLKGVVARMGLMPLWGGHLLGLYRETLSIQKSALKLWGGAPVDSSVPVLHFDAPLIAFDMVRCSPVHAFARTAAVFAHMLLPTTSSSCSPQSQIFYSHVPTSLIWCNLSSPVARSLCCCSRGILAPLMACWLPSTGQPGTS